MLNWIRRKRLSPEAKKKLLLFAARAEEAVVETHVENLFDLFETIGDELDLDRGLALYSQLLSLDEQTATAVANRMLARLEGPAERRSDRDRRFRHVFREGRPR